MSETPARKKKLAVICSQFPETHETFVIRELLALKNGGIDLEIYSLKYCRDRIRHEMADPLLPLTHYLAWDNPGTWLRAAACLARFPLASIQSLGWVLSRESHSLLNLAKGFIIWGQSLAISGEVKSRGFTHIHAHWATMPTTAAAVISRLTGTPFSFTAHAWDIFVKNPSLPEKVRLSAGVITCTDYNRRHLVRLNPGQPEKIILNYHGVDTVKFNPASEPPSRTPDKPEGVKWTIGEPEGYSDIPVFLSVGRFVEQKGYEDLIAAYRRLKERGKSFRAVIVGGGPLKSSIESQIQAGGLGNIVEIREGMNQPALHRLYREACAFVLPCVVAENSDRDGIPNVILEAMAMGMAIVTTDVSGIPEAIQDQRTGLVVPPHQPETLVQALELLLEHPALGERLGRQARELAVEKFSALKHMKQLVETMSQIMEKKTPGHS